MPPAIDSLQKLFYYCWPAVSFRIELSIDSVDYSNDFRYRAEVAQTRIAARVETTDDGAELIMNAGSSRWSAK
jgi:hypothetical protein